jgi:hypothetical protein
MRLLTLTVAVLLSGTALAETMTYTVAGTDARGGTYGGTVTLEELPKEGVGEGDRFRVTWNTGGAPVVGVGVVDGSNRHALAVAYVFDGQPGVSIMIENAGTLSGLWAVEGSVGTGTEVWTPADSGAPAAPAPAAGAVTYESAVQCAAATSFVVGNLRVTPGSDAAKIETYDKANSAWIIKVGELGKDKPMRQRIDDIQAVQAAFAADADGMGKALPIADQCVATAPAIE